MTIALDQMGARTEFIDLESHRMVGRLPHPVFNDTMATYVIEADQTASGSSVRIWAKPPGVMRSSAEALWAEYQKVVASSIAAKSAP